MIRITEEDFKNLSKRTSRLSQSMVLHDSSDSLHKPKTSKTTKTPSGETEGAISAGIEALMVSHRWHSIRINSGNVPVGEGIHKRWFKGATKGTPDRLFFRPHKGGGALLVFFEIKRPGKKPTDHQKYMMEKLRQQGAICKVVHSKAEALAIHEELKPYFSE